MGTRSTIWLQLATMEITNSSGRQKPTARKEPSTYFKFWRRLRRR
jgi:hypothetical protein